VTMQGHFFRANGGAHQGPVHGRVVARNFRIPFRFSGIQATGKYRFVGPAQICRKSNGSVLLIVEYGSIAAA